MDKDYIVHEMITNLLHYWEGYDPGKEDAYSVGLYKAIEVLKEYRDHIQSTTIMKEMILQIIGETNEKL